VASTPTPLPTASPGLSKGRIERHDDRIEAFFDSIGTKRTSNMFKRMSALGGIVLQNSAFLCEWVGL
jgi:hypothetical protein